MYVNVPTKIKLLNVCLIVVIFLRFLIFGMSFKAIELSAGAFMRRSDEFPSEGNSEV